MVVVSPDFFPGEQKVDPAAGFALRSINEQIDVEDLLINKANRFERGPNHRKVSALNQDVDIARIADGIFINPPDPFGHSVATGDSVRHTGRIERASRSAKPFLDLFRSHERPLPTDRFECWFRHDNRSLEPPIW